MQRGKPVLRYLNVLTDGKKHVAVCMRGDTLTKRSKSEWNACRVLAPPCTAVTLQSWSRSTFSVLNLSSEHRGRIGPILSEVSGDAGGTHLPRLA